MTDAAVPPQQAAMPPALRRVGHVLWRWFFGPAAQAPLTITHCVHSAAETFFTVSMAGSIFFSVSPDAARPVGTGPAVGRDRHSART